MVKHKILLTILLASSLFSSYGCSDYIYDNEYNKIMVKYICNCPDYNCDHIEMLYNKIEEDYCGNKQDVWILINSINLQTNKNTNNFISMGIDSLKDLDRSLASDFYSYDSYRNNCEVSELFSIKFTALKTYCYPLNIVESYPNSKSKLGLKIIYNYDSFHADADHEYHISNIIKLLDWGLQNNDKIIKSQSVSIYPYRYNHWDFGVLEIPSKMLKKIITTQTVSTFNILKFIGIILLIIIFPLIIAVKTSKN